MDMFKMQSALCLEDTGELNSAAPVESSIPASVRASRLRNTLLLIENLLDRLIEIDDTATTSEVS